MEGKNESRYFAMTLGELGGQVLISCMLKWALDGRDPNVDTTKLSRIKIIQALRRMSGSMISKSTSEF